MNFAVEHSATSFYKGEAVSKIAERVQSLLEVSEKEFDKVGLNENIVEIRCWIILWFMHSGNLQSWRQPHLYGT